ncbi:transposase [Curtobacterium flaccumfaciens pv. flaccumfaciens]|uniref:Mu transposase C-terminal domain-containing protein n=1 Tax=Curtobacterium flaccumfaciens TaxID=2035 RepID=UPI001BD12933|nr:Mu transposase C-terminal domain-containing protein [Curtobacterium flaccumfaciens]QVG66065.1 transposase [Curtobacterium flaccumfaciens pv. flaccumfaciens]
MSEALRWMRVGRQLTWDDEQVVIESLGEDVTLADGFGKTIATVPLADAQASFRGGTTSSPRSVPTEDVEERLSPKALARLHADQELLLLINTGLAPNDPPHIRPPAHLDPTKVDLGTRVRRIAELNARKPRTSGSRKGFVVDVKSEMRRIERVLERWADGSQQRLIDPRYFKPRGWRVEDTVVDALFTFLRAHMLQSTTTDTAAARAFQLDCEERGVEFVPPSSPTLRRLVRVFRNGFTELGGSAANRASAANVPDASEWQRLATRPGELVLIDTTKSNVWVKDPRTKRTYRLDLTIAIDYATRCIVGIAVTPNTPEFAIGLCLADILRAKSAEFVESWTASGELPYRQPVVGVPQRFEAFYSEAFHPDGAVTDNGRPYVSTYTTGQFARLGIHYEPQRTYTPTDKAQIERLFLTIKLLFESLMPGFTGGSVHEKGKHARDAAEMTPLQYERRIRQCADLYNHRIHTGLTHPDDPFARFSPYSMWSALIAETGALPDVPWEHDWIQFLPSEVRSIRGNRVRAARLDYRSPALKELRADQDVLISGKVRVFYDPTDLRRAWVFGADGARHVVRWKGLRADTPRFGLFETNGLAEKHADENLSDGDFDRLLILLLAGKLDGDGVDRLSSHRDLEQTRLLEAQTDKLTDGAVLDAMREEHDDPRLLDPDPDDQRSGRDSAAAPTLPPAPVRIALAGPPVSDENGERPTAPRQPRVGLNTRTRPGR